MKLYKDFNQAINETMFHQNCKLADITSVLKKDSKLEKSNYRPVMAKVFERLLCYQLAIYFGAKLSKFQWGFRKGYSAQRLIVIMEARNG